MYFIHIVTNYNFNSYGVTATQLTIFVLLCSFNNNIALKMAGRPAETCW